MSSSIRKTALCYWSEKDQLYIVQSMQVCMLIGMGETPEQAWEMFDALLVETDAEKIEESSTLASYVPFAVPLVENLSTAVYSDLEALSQKLECSRAEVIEYLLHLEKVATLPNSPGLPPFRLDQFTGDQPPPAERQRV
jgi:hypothetical protein